MEMRPYRRIVLPLPEDTLEAVDLTSDLHEDIGIIQVTAALYENAGESILNLAPECALSTFLDIEYKGGVEAIRQNIEFAKEHQVSFVSLHIDNPPEVFTAAVAAAGEEVEVLVSLDPNRDWRKDAANVSAAGITGFVCHPDHVRDLRDEYLESTIMVRGITPQQDDEDEEPARGDCPSRAMRRGADYLIVEGIATVTMEDFPENIRRKMKSGRIDPRVAVAKAVSETMRPYT